MFSIAGDGLGAADGDFSSDVSSGDVACFVFESSMISISSIFIGCGGFEGACCCSGPPEFVRKLFSNSRFRSSRSCMGRAMCEQRQKKLVEVLRNCMANWHFWWGDFTEN